jgi:RIO kinase 1
LPRPIAVGRPAPEWLIEESYEDRPVGILRSGKEAEVFLLERCFEQSTRLLAHKRFRPRHPKRGELRELGFSKGTMYRADTVYRAGWNLKGREARAVHSRTAFGDEIIASSWPSNEFAVLRRAWDAGASVPYALEILGDGVLMEFIGDWAPPDETLDGGGAPVPWAAPRLSDARLSGDAMRSARDQLLDSVAAMTRAQIVHGDLSAYNLLWWQDRLVVIDFPQAIDATENPAGPQLLHRDLANVGDWFGRRGAPFDVEAVFADLVVELLF